MGTYHARTLEVHDGEGRRARREARKGLDAERGANDQRQVSLLDLLLHHRRHLHFGAIVAEHTPPKHARAPRGPCTRTGVVAFDAELVFGRREEGLVA